MIIHAHVIVIVNLIVGRQNSCKRFNRLDGFILTQHLLQPACNGRSLVCRAFRDIRADVLHQAQSTRSLLKKQKTFHHFKEFLNR